jgi:hypothetical protein
MSLKPPPDVACSQVGTTPRSPSFSKMAPLPVFVLLALSLLGARAQTYSATYLPSNAPQQSEQGQAGTNQCGTGSNQTSQCQNAYRACSTLLHLKCFHRPPYLTQSTRWMTGAYLDPRTLAPLPSSGTQRYACIIIFRLKSDADVEGLAYRGCVLPAGWFSWPPYLRLISNPRT